MGPEIIPKCLIFLLDFLVWLVTGMWVPLLIKKFQGIPERTVPVKDDPSHRFPAFCRDNGLVTTPTKGVKSVSEFANQSFERFADKNCMGTREYLGSKKDDHGRIIQQFGGVRWRTFAQVGEQSRKFGAALRGLGLESAPDKTTLDQIKTPCSFAIFENTCAEWMIATQGCFSQSIVVATIYSTLGLQAVVDAVNECNITAILCNRTNIKALLSKAEEMKGLKTIIYTNDLVADAKAEVPSSKSVQVVSFDEFVETGDCKQYPAVLPKPTTCAVIMYTSGSTGKPKGVVVTHFNLLSCIAAAIPALGIREGAEVYVGYLPLAHIFELMAELALLGMGATIGYADPRTLTTNGAFPVGALEQFSPTVMTGVPKIWDIIKKGAEAKVSHASPVAKFAFSTALQARKFAQRHGTDCSPLLRLVFTRFSKLVGGRLRLAVSGGGALNPSVQDFVRACFGCPLVQGYGLTETCAGLAIQDPTDTRSGIAGVPLSCNEVKLLSCPEFKDSGAQPYLSEDRKDSEGNPVWGRGEVLVKGNNVTVGYYMQPDKSKEEYGEDGFFRTGDIGQFMPDGSLRIMDRKKNLVKLKGGEYIAIEHMEGVYGNSNWVDAVAGGICCFGNGDMDRPVALVQLNKATAKQHGFANLDEKTLESKELIDAVKADLEKEGKTGGLSNIEKLAGIVLIVEPWTSENGCLTAANKLNRSTIQSEFKEQFEALVEKGIHQ